MRSQLVREVLLQQEADELAPFKLAQFKLAPFNN
jgi:hypothetical protein